MQSSLFLTAMLVAAALAPARAQDAAAKDDGTRGKLTPYEWKKTTPPAQGTGTPVAVQEPEDEWVCEKGVVHPTAAQGDMKEQIVQSLGNPVMGVRRCWRKSDPSRVVERPFRMGDGVAEAVQESMKKGFPPLKKKPRKPAGKKAPAAPSAAQPASAPAEEEPGDAAGVKGDAPRLLRDSR
ncbi:MAG: hypothetical protein WC969_01450 [Elusimicrobiota bacterium]|jgi:hypothetical protein